jgi:hypothetical protein
MYEANRNLAHYCENHGRAIACEVLARRFFFFESHVSIPVDTVLSTTITRYTTD